MTPALTPAEILENHLLQPPCGRAQTSAFFPVFLTFDHLPQQKVEIPTTYGKAPTRSAGRCLLAVGAKATHCLYPAFLSSLVNRRISVQTASLGFLLCLWEKNRT